jgi:hypothetical protein
LQIGGHNNDGIGYSGDCWSAALSQVIADYPDRWESLAAELRGKFKADGKATETTVNPPKSPTSSDDCPWTEKGELATQPIGRRYMYRFFGGTPSEADMVRALFDGAGALNASTWPKELRPEPNQDVAEGKTMTKQDSQQGPDVYELKKNLVRETAIAEQFARQVLAETMRVSDVARPKLWLDMLMGLPQFTLNMFFILLLTFIGARWVLFEKMRDEIEMAKAWLEKESVFQKLSEAKSGSRKQLSLLDTFWSSVRNDFRPKSVVLLMAKKAAVRLVVGESQPELFRVFCTATRAVIDESAWLLRYLARALPALGFVGTILGILFALNGADGIVRATTQAERVSAMAAVTGPLAFAFSHTLFALMFGLVAGFFIDRLTAKERVELMAYEEWLFDRIDPAGRHTVHNGEAQ